MAKEREGKKSDKPRIISLEAEEENGGGAVPVLLIGEYRLTGFSEQQVEAALAQTKKSPTD